MSSYNEYLGENAVKSRREAVESHIKAVAAHALMPLSESQIRAHINQNDGSYLDKENQIDSDIHLRTITKSRLKRLGVHYSDEGMISSPIHRTEEEFCVEESVEERPSAKSEARSARLARLAKTINQWEDDLSHPIIQKPEPKKGAAVKRDQFKNSKIMTEKISEFSVPKTAKSPLKPVNKIEKNQISNVRFESSDSFPRKPPTIVSYSNKEPVKSDALVKRSTPTKRDAPKKPDISKKRDAPQPDASKKRDAPQPDASKKRDAPQPDVYKKRNAPQTCETPKSALDEPTRPKRIMWDSTIITSLENQGFERCESEEHLVYDFKEKHSPAKCLSPTRPSENNYKQTPISTPLVNSTSCEKVVSSSTVIESYNTAQQNETKRNFSEKKPLKTSSPIKPVTSKSALKSTPDKTGSAKSQVSFASSIVKELTPVQVSTSSKMLDKPKTIPLSRHESPLGHSRSPSPRKNTQVLEMAAQFEEGSPTKRIKETDPSELPLSQRKALFEKNKTNTPLLPKAPLTMAVPVKALTTPSPKYTPQYKSHGSPVRNVDPSEERLRKIKEEREKEIEFLRSRWDGNKRRNDDENGFLTPIHNNHGAKAVNEISDNESVEEEDEELSSPNSLISTASGKCPHTGYPMLNDVKKIKISPPKPGHLYPSISDIETETETESELPHNNNNRSNSEDGGDDDSMNESMASSVASLGQAIVKAATMSSANLKRHNESTALNDYTAQEAKVLGEIDEFLDEALREPSPKRSRDSSFDNSLDVYSSNLECESVRSDSFEFTRTTTDNSLDSYRTIDSGDIVESQPKTQLVHTISLYRRQKEMTIKSTTTIKRPAVSFDERDEYAERDSSMEQKQLPSEDEVISNRIHDLLMEINKQQTVISQATQALNLCSSTIEFSGSAEQTEAERLLLIASQKRLALNHEVDRLRVEKKLHPNNGNINERGDLTIKSLTLPLKMDVIRLAAREERCYYVLILVRSGPTVIATEMLPALPKNLKQTEPYLLTFKNLITLEKLYSDFTVSLEVYTLETRSKELLPHDIKYHITPSAKKEKMKMTPKKGKGDASRLVMGPVESPGGPLAVRSSSFKLSGFAVFSLREINKTSFTLSKVQYGSVLEGSIQVRMSCEMTLEGLEYHGFLTMFQDVSGFGAWHRRWCFLKDNTISYWLYPEHEQTKVPIDTIDLTESCNEGDIGLVPRDVCARPNTFLLETIRPRLPSDSDSLTMKTNKDTTLIRHLLAADTKEDRIEWCNKINQCLTLLKAWGKRPIHSIKHTQL